MTALVIFGAAGDLAGKKLLPAVYRLVMQEELPDSLALVGVDGSTKLDEASFVTHFERCVKEALGITPDEASWQLLAERTRYISGSFEEAQTYSALRDILDELSTATEPPGQSVFHLSIPPELFEPVTEKLNESGLTAGSKDGNGWPRIIVEKPLGTNAQSAKKINETLERAFAPQGIYRIDHYLAKTAVKRLQDVRFESPTIEAMLTREHVDHVQITIAESGGVEQRLKFYDATGAVRDVIQNHMLQLLALAAMEKPDADSPESLRQAKLATLRATKLSAPFEATCVRGQYQASSEGDAKGYRDELSVEDPERYSKTETYAALCMDVNTARWQGVPFYLRTGKRLTADLCEIAYMLKEGGGSIVIRVQPDPAVVINLPGVASEDLPLAPEQFEGYERLILDVFHGNPTLFPQPAEIDASWAILDPLLEFWDKADAPDPVQYASGTSGPESSDQLMNRDARSWRELKSTFGKSQ